jgi:hypothetical protein
MRLLIRFLFKQTTIKTPTTDIAGDALTDNLTLVELYRDDEIIMEFPDVTPGAELLFTDTDLEYMGNYSYQAVPYNADGVGMKSEKVVAYIGCDVPENVKNVKAMDMGTSVLLTWDKVTEVGQNGGYVNPDEVEYVIYECEPNIPWSKPEPLAVLADADSYTIEFNSNEGEPGFQKWFVVARNEAGGSSLTDESSATVLIGKPYDLPVVEGFADNNLHYYWESNSDPLTFSQSSDGDGYAIAMVMREPGEMYLNSGKLNVKDAANPVLLFDTVGFGVESVNVNGRVDGGEPIQLATESLSNDSYKTIKVELNELKSGNYAQFGLTATINNATTLDWWGDIEEQGDALVVDNIRVVDLLSHNLSVELSAPSTIQAGKSTEISAVVTNWGEQAAKDFTVTFMMDNEVLYQEPVSDVLAPFTSREFTAELNTTVFDEPGDRVIKVLVDYDADQKMEDNTAETILTVNDSEVPSPMNLTAENKENGVELNWDEPVSEPAEFTESFDNIEAFPTFSIGGITETQHEGSISEWTRYDGNGTEVYSWDNEAVQYDNRYAPSAWMVFDFAKAGFSNNVANSGNQVMLSMCPVPNDELGVSSADHWLISPELPGTAQQISFYARAITSNYGDETFEVLASTTDNKPESFEFVEAFATYDESWSMFTTALPEGTKYFAIRHTSNDVFGLMLDDISFNYVGVVCKYNIYCDSKLVASVENGVTTFTVDGALLEEGEHTFGVTAVYVNGQESKPAKATIMVTSDIRQIMVDGKPVDIYTIDGRLVRRQATSLNGLRGIYMVEGRKVLIP